MAKQISKLQVKDYELSRIQDNMIDALNSVLRLPILGGVLLQNISIGTSATLVPHTLGRLPLFWILARNNTNAVVWEVTAQTTDQFLALQASAPTTVGLLVG